MEVGIRASAPFESDWLGHLKISIAQTIANNHNQQNKALKEKVIFVVLEIWLQRESA